MSPSTCGSHHSPRPGNFVIQSKVITVSNDQTKEEEDEKSISLDLEHTWNLDWNISESVWQSIINKANGSISPPTIDQEEGNKSNKRIGKKWDINLKLAEIAWNKNMKSWNLDSVIASFRLLSQNDQLNKKIDTLFDHALNDPDYCVNYVLLCHLDLHVITDIERNRKGRVPFGKLLIQKCQAVFESDIYKGMNLPHLEQQILKCHNLVRKQQLVDKLDVEKCKAKKRYLANLILISRLNTVGLLNYSIILDCIDELFRLANQDSYECVCVLLQMTGQSLEIQSKPNNEQKYGDYFESLRQVVRQNKSSSQINQMILNLIKLRENKWMMSKQAEPRKARKDCRKEHNFLKMVFEQKVTKCGL